jgi:hypothetical protein
VVGYLPWGVWMLAGSASGVVMDRFCVAVADLHNLGGWTSFDIGQVRGAQIYFGRALELAEQGHHDALVANIRYRMGRVHLHHDAPKKALREFQLGQVSAQACGSALAVAIVCANQAWAYAKMGLDDQALALLVEVQTSSPEPRSPRRRPGPRFSPRPTCPPWSALCTPSSR